MNKKMKMIFLRKFLIVFLFGILASLFLPKFAKAAVTIYGKVYRDNELTEPVSGAEMYLSGPNVRDVTDSNGNFSITLDYLYTNGSGLYTRYDGKLVVEFPKVGSSGSGSLFATEGSYYAYCNADNCYIPQLEDGGNYCSTTGTVGLSANGVWPINTDGWYGFKAFEPSLLNISSAVYKGSGVTKEQDGSYTIDLNQYDQNNPPRLEWYTSVNEGTGIGAYKGYQLQMSTNNGQDKQTRCLNAPDGICLDAQSAEIYPTCMGGGEVRYGDGGQCTLYDNLGNQVNDTCLDSYHNYYFSSDELEKYIDSTLSFSVFEKFYQGAGGTADATKYYFIKYAPKVNIVKDMTVDIFPKCIIKDRMNTQSPDSSCGTYCEKRDNETYLKNGEVFLVDCYAQDERGNLATVIRNYGNKISCDGGENWYYTNETTQCDKDLFWFGINRETYNIAHVVDAWRPRYAGDMIDFQMKYNFDWTYDQYNSGSFEKIFNFDINLPKMTLEPELTFSDTDSVGTQKNMNLSYANTDAYPDYYQLDNNWFTSNIIDWANGYGVPDVDWLESLESPTESNYLDVSGNKSLPIALASNPSDSKNAYIVLTAARASAGTEINNYPIVLNEVNTKENDARVKQAVPNHTQCDVNDSSQLCNYVYQKITYNIEQPPSPSPTPTTTPQAKCLISPTSGKVNTTSFVWKGWLDGVCPSGGQPVGYLWQESNDCKDGGVNGQAISQFTKSYDSEGTKSGFVNIDCGDGIHYISSCCSAQVNSSSSEERTLNGIFITNKVIDDTSDQEVKISQDSHVVNNPPPGFNDLFAPLWRELIP